MLRLLTQDQRRASWVAAAVGQCWWKCSKLGWARPTSWADSCHQPFLTPHQPSRPFSAVGPNGNLYCSPHNLETGDVERLKNASGTKQVGCEQCIWWRLQEKLHGAMAVCFTQGWSVAAGSPALSNMTSSTFIFRLNWSTLKQCLPFLFVYFWKKSSFFFTSQRPSDYSLYAECVYVSELDMCFKEQNCT